MMKPLSNRVLVKRFNPTAQTEGGLFIPMNSQKDSQQAVVVAVGPGERLESGARAPMTVKVGDHVMLSQHAGREIEHEGEKYWLLREDDILGIIEHPEDSQ